MMEGNELRYLFVVAHPDDESDAAGGTINKLIKEGNDGCSCYYGKPSICKI